MRPVALIQHDLDTALAYKARYEGHPPPSALAAKMRDINEREIGELREELAEAEAE